MNLDTKLNLETAKISWREVERFFAAGKAIHVSTSLDLIQVAKVLQADDTQALSAWMASGQVAPVSDEQALAFADNNSLVWALVIAPWVLIQPE